MDPESINLAESADTVVNNFDATSSSSDVVTICNSVTGSDSNALSKNKLRKIRNHDKLIQNRPLKRQKERDIKKQKKLKKSLGNNEKLAIAQKLSSAIGKAPKVVIDCQYDNKMTYKEHTRFAQQLRRSYSSNKASEQPLHLIFTSLLTNSDFFGICCKQNDGFAKYIVDMQEKSVLDLFPVETIVYLSPDSPNVLVEFETDKIYVIGGIVDETTNKNISLKYSNSHNITTARLPIDENFVADSRNIAGTFKKVLTVNQVFDVILEWYQSKDWVKAISAGLPERTGFIPRNKVKQPTTNPSPDPLTDN